MTTVASGTSQTFTANVRGETIVLTVNGGVLATVTLAGSTPGVHKMGPLPKRRTFGPLEINDTVMVSAETGDVVVEFGTATPGNSGAVPPGSGGTGAVSSVAGKTGAVSLAEADLTDGAALVAAVAANTAAIANALKAPTNWAASSGGGTPALTSGTAVLGTAYKNTTAGVTALSPAIDGISQVSQGDILICFTAGTYTLLPNGGGFLGTYASTATLQTAYPAASNGGCTALAGGVFVVSNGTTWAAPGGTSLVAGYDYTPGPLFQTGIPILMLPSGTVAAGGLLTISGTNTPPAYPQGCYAYVSASALYSGSPAGWVWAVLAGSAGGTATSIQLYNNYIAATGTTAQLAGTSAGATIANGYSASASPTTVGITGGTHTQPTATNIYAPGPSLAGNYMGNSGRAVAECSIRVNGATANIKSFLPGPLWAQLNPTTSNYTNVVITSINNGSPGHQNSTFNDISAGGTQSYVSYDSTTTQALNPRFNMAAGGSGNDFAACEALIMTIVPRT